MFMLSAQLVSFIYYSDRRRLKKRKRVDGVVSVVLDCSRMKRTWTGFFLGTKSTLLSPICICLIPCCALPPVCQAQFFRFLTSLQRQVSCLFRRPRSTRLLGRHDTPRTKTTTTSECRVWCKIPPHPCRRRGEPRERWTHLLQNDVHKLILPTMIIRKHAWTIDE